MSRSALRLLTPLSRPLASPPSSSLLVQQRTATAPSTRPFFSLPTLPSSPPQTLTATRTLPYPPKALYALVADIDAYASFVPYCSESRVTARDPSPPHTPTEADLRVGWGGFEETFTSRLRCRPDRSVEAISGADLEPPARGATSTSSSSSSRRSSSSSSTNSGGAVFTSLVTRWELRPLREDAHDPATQVDLVIRFQFANPLYAAVSAAVSDKVAGIMIEAFEKRARRILGQPKKL
ncbi:Coenzyme Q-binding protein coq10 like [Verticillium longisporum]|nr:Coenzyme Q-binding protein coq10 like [Verticillium longisporum]